MGEERPVLGVAILADPVVDRLTSVSGRGDGIGATWLPQFASCLLARPDLQVTWISVRRDLRERRRETLGRHAFVELPQLPVTVDVVAAYALTARSLVREIERAGVRVVHAWGTERSYPAVLSRVHQPGVLSFNGMLNELKQRGALPEGWRWNLQARWERGWARSADVLCVESDWALDAARRLVPDGTMRVIPYGVHPSFYALPWQPDPRPTVFFAGTVSEGKGVDILIEAVHRLDRPDWRFVIAGDGPLRKELEARSPGNVEWLGLVGWQDLQRELGRAWCLVLPTLADSNPNIVKEARVVGLPVVTTRHGGQADYLRDGGNAEIVDKVSPGDLAMAIDRLLGSGRDEVMRRGAVGHAEDRARFETSKTAAAFADVYALAARKE